MTERDVLIGAVLEEEFTLDDLAGACAVTTEWVVTHVREGLLNAEGDVPERWRFSVHTLQRARRIFLLERDFEAVPELAALVADLIEELQASRARQQHTHTR
jgi:chaperone modulatory protein CbpM